MKKIKYYEYKYKYMKYFLPDLELNNDDILNISISEGSHIEIHHHDNCVFSDDDNGEMMILLKGLGKISVIAEIAFYMEIGSSFDINDDEDNKYGVSKIETLGNQYLVIGGYNHWSILLDITGMKKNNVVDNIVTDLLSYRKNYGFSDLKSMYILASDDVLKNVDNRLFSKPYLYHIQK